MATSAPHISDITDEPTHKMKGKNDENGDTGEQIAEEEENGPEKREGEGKHLKTFQKGTLYSPLTLALKDTLKPTSQPAQNS